MRSRDGECAQLCGVEDSSAGLGSCRLSARCMQLNGQLFPAGLHFHFTGNRKVHVHTLFAGAVALS
jgi:hypothetical protein